MAANNSNFVPQSLSSIFLSFCMFLFALPKESKADESLELITTIRIERDSTVMTCVSPIGDFNADGYPDLAIGVLQDRFSVYEAVYIYYGGPDFDNSPDLIMVGEPQNENSYCIDPWEMITGYGYKIFKLNDFNGDNFDDFAVSAYNYCPAAYQEGRIYVYFGSTEPDTIADIIIDGNDPFEMLGSDMESGDYNGDGFTDLLAITDFIWNLPGSRGYIYFGGDDPDSLYDWRRDFLQEEIYLQWNEMGFNINNDHYDDFSFYAINVYNDETNYYVFYGGNPPDSAIDYSNENDIRLLEDISGDGIDDVMIFADSDWYLSLGGESIDFGLDYFVCELIGQLQPLFVYSLDDMSNVLIMNNNLPGTLTLYNTGVPFDTIPRAILSYNHHLSHAYELGDINADGIEDMVLRLYDDFHNSFANVYSIFTEVSIYSDDESNLPEKAESLSCYPNPFNSSTTITIGGLPALTDEMLDIRIYDILGRAVKSLTLEIEHRRQVEAVWDGTDNSGNVQTSGVYFVSCKIIEKQITAKLIMLK